MRFAVFIRPRPYMCTASASANTEAVRARAHQAVMRFLGLVAYVRTRAPRDPKAP